MIKVREYFSKVIETKFDKSLVRSENDHENINSSIKCWICKKEGEVKVKNSCSVS